MLTQVVKDRSSVIPASGAQGGSLPSCHGSEPARPVTPSMVREGPVVLRGDKTIDGGDDTAIDR